MNDIQSIKHKEAGIAELEIYRWVKASERLPNDLKAQIILVKIDGDIHSSGYFDEVAGKMQFVYPSYTHGNSYHSTLDKVEWMEETTISEVYSFNQNALAAKEPTKPEGDATYTEGIAGDGAAILKDGVMMTISEILAALNSSSASFDCDKLKQEEAIAFQNLINEKDKQIRKLEAQQQSAYNAGKAGGGTFDTWKSFQ